MAQTKAGPLPDLCGDCKRDKKREKKKELRKHLQEVNKTSICSLCGREYTNDSGHSRRCPDCRSIISGRRKGRVEIVQQRKETSLAEDAATAKRYGMSYGRYVALRAAGMEIKKENEAAPVNMAWEDWKEHLYSIINTEKNAEKKKPKRRTGGHNNDQKSEMPILRNGRTNEQQRKRCSVSGWENGKNAPVRMSAVQ